MHAITGLASLVSLAIADEQGAEMGPIEALLTALGALVDSEAIGASLMQFQGEVKLLLGALEVGGCLFVQEDYGITCLLSFNFFLGEHRTRY
jgi:hypothetical protein